MSINNLDYTSFNYLSNLASINAYEVNTDVLTKSNPDISNLQFNMLEGLNVNQTIQVQLNNATGNLTTLQSEMNTAQSDINTLQSEMNTAQSDINTLQSEMNAVEGVAAAALSLAGVANAAVTALAITVTGQGVTIATHTGQIATLDGEMNTAQDDISALQTKTQHQSATATRTQFATLVDIGGVRLNTLSASSFDHGLTSLSVEPLAITSTLAIAANQTSGILNIGTLAARSGNINIGTGATSTAAVNISSGTNTNAPITIGSLTSITQVMTVNTETTFKNPKLTILKSKSALENQNITFQDNGLDNLKMNWLASNNPTATQTRDATISVDAGADGVEDGGTMTLLSGEIDITAGDSINISAVGVSNITSGQNMYVESISGEVFITAKNDLYTQSLTGNVYVEADKGNVYITSVSGDVYTYANKNLYITADLSINMYAAFDLYAQANSGNITLNAGNNTKKIKLQVDEVDKIIIGATDISINTGVLASTTTTQTVFNAAEFDINASVATTIDTAILDINATSAITIDSASTINITAVSDMTFQTTNPFGDILLTSAGTNTFTSVGTTQINCQLLDINASGNISIDTPSTIVVLATTNINTTGTKKTDIGNSTGALDLQGTPITMYGTTNINRVFNLGTNIGNISAGLDFVGSLINMSGNTNINSFGTKNTVIGNTSGTLNLVGSVIDLSASDISLKATDIALTTTGNDSGQISITASQSLFLTSTDYKVVLSSPFGTDVSGFFLISQGDYVQPLSSNLQLGYTEDETTFTDPMTTSLIARSNFDLPSKGVWLVVCGYEWNSNTSNIIENKELIVSLTTGSSTPAAYGLEYYEEINDSAGSGGARQKGAIMGVVSCTALTTLYVNASSTVNSGTNAELRTNLSWTRIG